MNKKEFKQFKMLSPFFKTQLTADLGHTDRFLGIPEKWGVELCRCLGGECYTYLAIGDECHWELVRVEVEQGRLYLAGRGLEGTQKREWRCGTCVEFHVTAAAHFDLMEQARKRVGRNKQDKHQNNYSGVIKSGVLDFHVKDGQVVSCKRTQRNLPTNTVTRNTTVCWDENGCPTQAGGGERSITQLNCGK